MRRFVLLSFILPSMALAQPAGGFRHIVIVVQENRTPDNLFGSNPSFEPGVDIASSGLDSQGSTIPLGPVPLGSCYDVGHIHADFTAMYDGGRMDGADREVITPKMKPCTIPPHPQFRYVDNSTGTVQPYFDIAAQYGFANRMFQTNQSASMPAHQFLFGGTSAPSPTSRLFADEQQSLTSGFGCTADATQRVSLIGPTGKDGKLIYPCFNRPTMATLLDRAKLSWRYYINEGEPTLKTIWDAPSAIASVCGSTGEGGTARCAGASYVGHVVNTQAQVLTDVANCALPSVSWAIPNVKDSDHAGGDNDGGPSWVASIVNAIGQQPACSGGETYWQDTAILIVWDDWGGWYDHVPPLLPNGQASGWGAGYTYGFRVPLLVVSAFTPAGYVDNTNYDFGSVLAFVESNFGLGHIGGGTYADAYAAGLDGFFTLATPRGFRPIAAPLGAAHFLHAVRSSGAIDSD